MTILSVIYLIYLFSEGIMSGPAENASEHDLAAEPGAESPPKGDHNDDSDVAAGEKKWPGWPGESVFRVLVPAQKVGSIIGRKGEFVKKMCEESRARIKVLDAPPGAPERIVSSLIIEYFRESWILNNLSGLFPLQNFTRCKFEFFFFKLRQDSTLVMLWKCLPMWIVSGWDNLLQKFLPWHCVLFAPLLECSCRYMLLFSPAFLTTVARYIFFPRISLRSS